MTWKYSLIVINIRGSLRKRKVYSQYSQLLSTTEDDRTYNRKPSVEQRGCRRKAKIYVFDIQSGILKHLYVIA